MTIVAYRCYTPVFDSRYGESNETTTLPSLPPENRELFLMSEQDQKFLFSVQATSCKFSNIHYLSERFALELQGNIAYLWKNKINDIGTPLDFCQEKNIRITTLL